MGSFFRQNTHRVLVTEAVVLGALMVLPAQNPEVGAAILLHPLAAHLPSPLALDNDVLAWDYVGHRILQVGGHFG